MIFGMVSTMSQILNLLEVHSLGAHDILTLIY